jgi:hypothetical protein
MTNDNEAAPDPVEEARDLCRAVLRAWPGTIITVRTLPVSPERDAAQTWAGGLAMRLGSMSLADLEAAWTCAEGVKHRKALKADTGAGPAMLQQLADYVRERAETLKAA